MFAAEVPVGRGVVELLGFGVETQLLSRTPGYVAGVTHYGADVPGVDILVKRFVSAAAHGVEEVTDVGLLDALSGGSRRALAQAITLVESTLPAHRLRAEALIDAVVDHYYHLYPIDNRIKPDSKMVRRLEPYLTELAFTMDLNKPIGVAGIRFRIPLLRTLGRHR